MIHCITTYYLLLTTYYLLVTTYYSLLTTDYLLLTTYLEGVDPLHDLHLLGGLHLRLGPDGDGLYLPVPPYLSLISPYLSLPLHLRLSPDGHGHGRPYRDEAREGDARQRGQLHSQAAVHERLARVGGG